MALSPGNEELRALACTIAQTAGELIAKRRSEGVEVAATKSTSTDIVTHTDRESERLIRSMLADARPGDAFYGEESDATSGTSGLTWVVDPIDGTVNFLYGLPEFAVSIAAVEGGFDPESWRAVAAAVVNPSRGETFSAMAGGGATLERHGETDVSGGPTRGLAVNAPVDLGAALIGTGFGYDRARRVGQAEVVARIIGEVRDIRRAGSAALDLCAVAAGRLDGFFERGLQPWDHAAGALIASEAGARVGGLRGRAATSAMTIAAEPGLFAALEALLIPLDADQV